MEKTIGDKLYESLGDFLITFGAVETAVSSAIKWIGDWKPNTNKMAEILKYVLDNSAFENNLNTLEHFVKQLSKEYISDWNGCLADIKKLQKKRNDIYAHGVYGIDQDILIKKTRKYSWKEISLDELKDDCNLLKERFRQLFDSVYHSLEILDTELGETEHWISKFPRLLI